VFADLTRIRRTCCFVIVFADLTRIRTTRCFNIVSVYHNV